MLFQEEKEKKRDSLAQKTIYVVSERDDADELICQQIRLAGIDSVILINGSLTGCRDGYIPEDAKGVIIDIENETNASRVLESLPFFVHRSAWCCFVGNNDQISFSQQFTYHCKGYFHIQHQKHDLIQAVLTCDEKTIIRKPVSVSILGCKGGVGCTTIGYKLATDIERVMKISTVYVQGKYCSSDIDLLTGRDITRNVVTEHKNLNLLSTDDLSFPDITDSKYSRYNFIVFEQSVVSLGKEVIQNIISSSLCIVLVVDRSISSLRTASRIIEQIKIIVKTTNISRRVFVCMNDSRPRQKGSLSIEEVEKIISRKIDVCFPYEGDQKVRILERKSTARHRIASLVLGRQVESRVVRLFNALLRKI